MVKRCSYYKMCVSTICPTNWLRLATYFQLRVSGGLKLGFEGAQSFSICKRNNSDNNFGQYQWKIRYPSFRTSTVHAISAAEMPSLLSSVVRYQIRKYSVVRKGRIQEPIQKITKSKKARRKVDAADSNEVFYRMEFDGASKGNPGKAGAGAVLRNQDGSVICELKEGVGRATNNVAEYRAVILGLKVALSRGIQKIHVQGDSNLVCMQIQDLWKIKSQNIAELFEEAKELKSKFKEFRINHIYREFNGKADALANAAIELKNGEIKNDVATYRLDNPHEMASSSQRKTSKKLLETSLPLEKPLEKLLKSGRTISSDDLLDTNKDLLDMASSSVECLTKTSKTRRMKSKVGLTDPNKDSVDTASPSVECLTKTSKTRRMKSKVGLPDFNKDSLDTASPSVECLTKASKTRSMKSKVGLKDLNKEMIQVSSLLEEPVGKYSKSKETRRKLKVTDSNEEPLEKPSTSRRRRKLQTDPDEDPHTNSSKKLVGKAMVSKKSRGKLDMINSNEACKTRRAIKKLASNRDPEWRAS
ncbi:uncharacterized protein LOC131048686 [Cryptomeria japonica]|uniref:uncharacterized protein LOC131048686 n=1 Tax=Cryptomeria japonica TaxID=3369 RepID=UPI0027DA1F73|nr:uncharacterized protein LOC131048686 [Cryptomeria japonica]